ncbi:MAG: hypothetical protein HYY68_08395 [Thaumarchaeota archaeon]|nr:hypothetical protein [Nitrososphaerota archaeon]
MRTATSAAVSSREVGERAKETVKSVRELLRAVKNAVHDQLRRGAPTVVNALDRSFETASKTLLETLRVVDKKTNKEQTELLRAYQSFLQKQVELIEGRLKVLERAARED